MSLKSIPCRDHGGTFEIEARRGRPPVKCGGQYPTCSMAPKNQSKRRVAEAMESPLVQETVKRLTLAEWRKAAKDAGFSAKVIGQMRTPAMFRELLGEAPVKTARASKPITVEERITNSTVIRGTRKTAQPVAEVESRVNPSVPKAHAAKALLEPKGWKVTGRASFVGEEAHASIIAFRGEEQLLMVWVDGGLATQNYSMWNMEKPSANNAPDHKLPFDPDEMTDKELIRAMSGMKVTWWNRLGQSTETAVVSKDKIRIEHHFNGSGDETPADRIVSFVDMNGEGFRSFRMGALLKIG